MRSSSDLPGWARNCTRARSLQRTTQCHQDWIFGLQSPFGGPALAYGRSLRARYCLLAKLLPKSSVKLLQLDFLSSLKTLEAQLFQQGSSHDGSANDRAMDPAGNLASDSDCDSDSEGWDKVSAPQGSQMRRWHSLWNKARRELLLGSEIAPPTGWMRSLVQPVFLEGRSSRHGQLVLCFLGWGLFGIACPDGGVHWPRHWLHSRVFGNEREGLALWNLGATCPLQFPILELTPTGVRCGCPWSLGSYHVSDICERPVYKKSIQI